MTRPSLSNIVVASWLVAVAGIPDARSQTVLATAYGNRNEYSGWSVAAGPDLDGDGIQDVAVGAIGTGATRARIRILSGIDLHELKVLHGASDKFGYALCWCGDLDGDGIAELAVGAPAGQQVHVFSPASWNEIRTLNSSVTDFGFSLVDAGDVNGDGFDDLVVGVPGGPINPAAVIVYSGANGSILFQSNGGYDALGWSIAMVGDVNGDGISDIAAGAPHYSATSHSEWSGAVSLFSGVDGTLLWQTIGTYSMYQDSYGVWHYEGQNLGFSVTRAGDFNGDGIPDVVAGQYRGGFNDILSGADGSILFQFGGGPEGPLTAIGDNDGDGRPDVAFPVSSAFSVLSGSDWSTLWLTFGATGQEWYRAIAPIGDVDGDGRTDLLVGNATDSTNGNGCGAVQLISIDDLWLNYHGRWLVGGAYISISVRKGPPGNLSGIAVTAVNGAPTFMLAGIATFDATGTSTPVNGFVPTGLSGTTVDLIALAIDASGRLVQSCDHSYLLK